MNLTKFNKAKCKVLHMGRGNPGYQYRLGGGGEGIESSPPEKDLEVLMDEKLDMTQQSVLAAQKANSVPDSHQEKCGQRVKGGDSAPLLCSGETPPGVPHPALEPSAQEHGPVGAGPGEGHKNDPRAGAPLQGGQAERVGAVQPGQEKAPETLLGPSKSVIIYWLPCCLDSRFPSFFQIWIKKLARQLHLQIFFIEECKWLNNHVSMTYIRFERLLRDYILLTPAKLKGFSHMRCKFV